MDEKMKELIAVGAAVTSGCVPCLDFHCKKSLMLGATRDEIKEAVEVGRMVRRGAKRVWDKAANKIIDAMQDGGMTTSN